MGESAEHMKFVNRLLETAKEIIPNNFHVFIYSDRPDSLEKPPRTKENFVPDLYYCHNGLLIIGEAKTAKDVDREHSISQYESYYDEAARFNGKAILLFAIPWFTKGTVKNIIRRLNNEKKGNIEARFITEIGEVDIL